MPRTPPYYYVPLAGIDTLIVNAYGILHPYIPASRAGMRKTPR